MNTDKLTQLRDAIQAADEKFFYYGRTFAIVDRPSQADWQAYDIIPQPGCGTAGCVAGWACMLFHPGRGISSSMDLAKETLELDGRQAQFLFLDYCNLANRADAIQRINWLLEGRRIISYSWRTESWWPDREN